MNKMCRLHVGPEERMMGFEQVADHHEPEYLEFNGEQLVTQKVKWSDSGTYDILVPGFLKEEADDDKTLISTPTSICLRVEEISEELQPEIKEFLKRQGYKGTIKFSTY